ncbi:MAG: protein kinase, partial [Gemmatimonadales bacterium]
PNVCGIYDFGETSEGTIYLAMEFIEGESLSDTLRREGTIIPERAVSILQQTADALQVAHDLGIVHRDLKPDNIMLARGRGGRDVVKVVDFGIAKAMTGEEGQKVTKTGLVVGTPEYMSPEQLSGDVLDGRSDIYSLALVFYRMLSATLPFEADSAQEMMIKRLTDKPRGLNEVAPGAGFTYKLQQVIDKALERMPADRYTSAVEFANDAAEAIKGIRPPEPPIADAEAATQLIDTGSSEGITEEMLPDTQVSERQRAPSPPRAAPEPATPTTPAPIPSPAAKPKKAPIVAIVGAVAVVAGGGIGYVMLGGGGETPAQPVAEDTTAADSDVTGNTAPRQPGTEVVQGPGGGDQPGGGEQPGGEPPSRDPNTRGEPGTVDPTETEPATGPLVDSAAIDQELLDMVDQVLEASTRTQAMARAEAIFNNPDVPTSLRAGAASNVALGHFENGSTSQACDWMSRALRLVPGNSTYIRMSTAWGCQ